MPARDGRPEETTMHEIARVRGAPLPRAEERTAWWAAMPLDLWGAVLAVIAAGGLKLAGILP